jgi:protein TonB
MVHAPPPRYPIESRRKREQGTVILAVVLTTDGTVADVRIARSSGYSRLDEAARGTVKKWRWSPTVRGGVAVQVRGTVEIPFVLTG